MGIYVAGTKQPGFGFISLAVFPKENECPVYNEPIMFVITGVQLTVPNERQAPGIRYQNDGDSILRQPPTNPSLRSCDGAGDARRYMSSILERNVTVSAFAQTAPMTSNYRARRYL
ncbi:MAG: hypothetical protein HN368_04780 [Spirochaetales bacterium]|jgi:hypothetical protein|nr:hypothetical protein [Spirochaetales bacterium]